MGCDIHTLLQVFKNDTWHTVAFDVSSGRHYVRFGILAGVRNGRDYETISEPRGFPKDSDVALDENGSIWDFWLGDHSHSWVLLSEMLDYEAEHKTGELDEMINDIKYEAEKFGRMKPQDVRFVFGFDS